MKYSVFSVVGYAAYAAADSGDCLCACGITDSNTCSLAETSCGDDGGDTSCESGNVYWSCEDYNCNIDDYSDCDTICTQSGCVMDSWSCTENKNTCFHEDSSIHYKGKEYTMQELADGAVAECTVPHTPKSRGVIIETSCEKAVRVTDTHLIATSKGFQTAVSIKEGDTLFGDFDGSETCTVLSNKREESVQQYFGLNCVHSEVLANGIRASTFGDFHTLPSWYMYYAGNAVGVEKASEWGDYVAEWYYNL